MQCSICESDKIIAIEYAHDHPDHYDGISEWMCEKCGTRWGRWTGNILKEDEYEPRYGVERGNSK